MKIMEKFRRTFFIKYCQYFNDDYKYQCDHLPGLGDEFEVKYQIRLFDKLWDIMGKETLRKKGKKKRVLSSDDIHQMRTDLDRPIELFDLIRRAYGDFFFWAVFFRILKNSATIVIPYIMKEYLTKIRNFSEISLLESVLWCGLAALLAFWREIWGQLSSRWGSQAKKRCLEILRDNIFIRMLDSDIDFLSQADVSFLSKMLLYETAPIDDYVNARISMYAAPIPIGFAIFLIFLEFKTQSDYVWILCLYFFVLAFIIYLIHKRTVRYREKFRTEGSKCSGQVHEMVADMKFVKGNSLHAHILRQIWKFRKSQVKLLKAIHISISLINFLFSSPVIAGSLLLIFLNKVGSKNGELDVVTVFTITGTVSSLKTILTGFSDALNSIQDFRPASKLFELFFNEVSRTPRISVLTAMTDTSISEKEFLRIQHPRGMTKKKALSACSEVINYDTSDFAFFFQRCTFFSRLRKTKELLEIVARDGHLETKVNLKKKPLETLLRDIDIVIPRGKNVCVMGDEHSGRQIFLDCLSNENELASGLFLVRGTVAHFDIHRFELLKHTSIIENIILDRPMHRKRLEKICSALGLVLHQFVGGETGSLKDNPNITDMTKTKILLARALYSRFDTFVFSGFFDLLSLGEKIEIFDSIVRQHLVFNTVVYQSNDRNLAERSDYIIVFEAGKIVEHGTPQLLMRMKSNFYSRLTGAQTMRQGTLFIAKSSLEERKVRRRPKVFGIKETDLEGLKRYKVNMLEGRFVRVVVSVIFYLRFVRRIKKKKDQKMKREEENKILMSSTFDSMMKLLKTHMKITPALLVLSFLISDLSILAYDGWLGFWSAHKSEPDQQMQYFIILVCISIGSGFYNFFRDLLYYSVMRRISNHMYFSSVKRIVTADLRWLEKMTVPIIIYNVTNYQIIMDEDFNFEVYKIMNSAILVFIAFVIGNLFFPGIFTVVTIIVVLVVRNIITRAVRSIRITLPRYLAGRVKWFDCYTTALEQSVSMRFINRPRYLFARFEKAVFEVESNRSMHGSMSSRWLGLRTAIITSFLLFSIYICPVIIYQYKLYDYSQSLWVLSIALLWAGRLSEYLSNFIGGVANLMVACEGGERLFQVHTFGVSDQIREIEVKEDSPGMIGSVERGETYQGSFLETTNLLMNENDSTVVKIERFTFKNHDQILLENINLTINRGENISLLQEKGHSVKILFDLILGFRRIEEGPTKDILGGSSFELFGKPLQSIPLEIIRDRVVYLVPDPLILTGTWRDNIDPMRAYNDDEIVRVLGLLGFHQAYKERRHDWKPPQQKILNNQKYLKQSHNSQAIFSKVREVNKMKVLRKAASTKIQETRNFKFRVVSKIIIMLIRWRKSATQHQARIKEDLVLVRDLNSLEEPNSIDLAGDRISYTMGRKTKRQNQYYRLDSVAPDIRMFIEKIINKQADKENASTYLKRIVALARAILIKPDIIITDEDSFIISNDFDQVNKVMEKTLPMFTNTTILCRITCFNLVDKFQKCVVFHEKSIKRICSIQDFLTDLDKNYTQKELQEVACFNRKRVGRLSQKKNV